MSVYDALHRFVHDIERETGGGSVREITFSRRTFTALLMETDKKLIPSQQIFDDTKLIEMTLQIASSRVRIRQEETKLQ